MLLGMKSKRLSCVLLAGFFSCFTFLWLWYFARETFYINHKELGVKRPQFWFSHLQPLRDMFRNLTIDRKDKKHCMVASDEFSDLNEKGVKESVLLLIVVSTAPSRQDRREAIRQTWWTKCRGKVVCKFFTDGIQISKEDQQKLLREKQVYKDLKFQPVIGGRTFGLRYLYQMMWAAAKYDFKYYLRLDDDYFVCLGRLLHELRYRPSKMLCWGSYHCNTHLSYVDEAWTLLTHDVIVRILSQHPQRMLCHPHADQELPIWMESVINKNENLIRFDDQRLYHYPPARTVKRFKKLANPCDLYIGIHGSSPELMRMFWNSGSDKARRVSPLTEFSATCGKPFVFDISLMWDAYKFDLRPCIENPLWTPGETMWMGILSGTKKGTLPCP
ncbi:uncharacterized protein [Acropora muricata]|uniref:uncharacterized protein n=1 Tax=Acropora muricata TaxID=159855 RepID=UPI0034E48801